MPTIMPLALIWHDRMEEHELIIGFGDDGAVTNIGLRGGTQIPPDLAPAVVRIVLPLAAKLKQRRPPPRPRPVLRVIPGGVCAQDDGQDSDPPPAA